MTFLTYFYHAEEHLARHGVVGVHTQVYVLPPLQYPELAVYAFEPFDDASDDCRQLVGHLQIIHETSCRHLVPIDGMQIFP